MSNKNITKIERLDIRGSPDHYPTVEQHSYQSIKKKKCEVKKVVSLESMKNNKNWRKEMVTSEVRTMKMRLII